MQLIPKVIHYCWFGKTEKPISVEKCIESWHRLCPDYEIKEWNEDNYDIHKHPFMEKAFTDKKWAFVSDYARLDILYTYGGLYLDTDVEIVKNFDRLLKNHAFMGFERDDLVGDGAGFGCVAGLNIFEEMMRCYDDMFEYIESPKLRTVILLKHGLILNGKKQDVDEVRVYPVEYFCPKNYLTGVVKVTSNTYSIHHFDGSWHEGNSEIYVGLMRFLNRRFGEEKGLVIFNYIVGVKDKIKKLLGRD